MRSLTVVLLLLLCGPAAAQQRKENESSLMTLLARLAGANSFAETKGAPLPAAEPLKVYVVAPGQDAVVENFRGWVEEWNRTEGDGRGRVEVVGKASQADVILARLVTPFKSKTDMSVYVAESGPVGVRGDGRPSASAGGVYRVEGSDVRYSAKVYLYVGSREANRLNILWRATDSVRLKGREVPPDGDFGSLRGRLKAKKDAQAAGDELRDQFFKLLRARGRPHQ